jgi:ribosomal protein L7Ae-like RNA K-turn-binding protein
MEDAVAQRVLRLIGLGVRSRGVVVGVEQVRDAVKRGKVVLAVVAEDASKHSIAKVVPLLEALHVRTIRSPSATRLGHAVGREQTAAVGVVDRELARGIRELMDESPARGQEESG